MSPHESMVRRTRWDSVADPARLAEYVPTGAVTYMIPSRNRHELPGPDGRPAADKAEAIFELMTKLGIRYVLEPADSQPGAQFVRPVEEVFRASGQGTCLDLCVAFSSAALDAGLHPMILTVTKSNTGNKSDKKCHSIVLIPRNRTWSASGRPEPVADSEVVHEPFLLDDMPLKAMVYRTATGSGALLAIDVQQASCKPDGTPLGDWESAVSGGADFLTGETGWDWDVCVDIGALRGAMETPHSVYAPPRTRVLEPGYLKPAPGATRSPLQLIKARTGIVPFTGRDKLTELTDWANKQPGEGREDLAVAVVTGVGGSGKTRLAAELCSNLEKNGWVAGFVPKTTGLSEAELTWLTRVESHLLLVLDYAEESHKEELTRLLGRLRERGAPTRVVLTARSAGAWLDDLLEDDVLSGAMAQGLRRFELPRQAETSTKMAKRAAKRFARYLETPEPTDVEIPQNSRWTTLDFVFHGWLIASEVDAAGLPSSRERLYEDILRREIEYWQDEAKRQGMTKVSEATLRTSAAALSLIGPRTVPETTDVLSRLPDWSDINLRKTYAELLSTVLADPGEAYVLRPDPVAEKLVAEVFVDDGETLDVPEELLDKVLPPDPLSDPRLNETTCPPAITRRAEAHKAQSKHACEAITRCASQGDAPATQLAHSALRCRQHLWISGLEAALKQGGPFVTALEDALKGGMDIPAAEIADSIPLGHSYLRSLAVTATTRDQEKDTTPTDRAAYMNNLSTRLSKVGDREGALKAVREAVEIYRELAEENPATFNPDLAGSLNNLSLCLSGVGDRGGALEAIREAVRIYRGLAKKNPGAFNPDLAASLNNLSNRLADMGDLEGALKAAREAVGIWYRLAEGNPAAFLPNLTSSLNTLSARLPAVSDRGGALEAIREAVKIYRWLAEENPAAFNPDLAASLNNLSGRFSEAGEREGALKAAREAVGIRRGLAKKNPGAFNPDLAASLNNLSNRLADMGERGGALKAAREAVGIRRGLAEGNPAAFNPDLAASLNNLSVMFSEVGDRGGALKAIQEAVGIRRGLAKKNPGAFNPDLAMSLNNLSNRLADMGERGGALKAAREAVEIYRGLAKKNPGAFNPDLAMSLNNLSGCLSEVGDRGGALDAIREAVGIYRGLAEGNPAAFNPGLAASLNNLSIRLSEVGDRGGALKAVREAVGIRRGLAEGNPAAFNPDLAASLNNLSNRLSDVGNSEGALKAIREAVEIRRGLAAGNPAVFEADLIRSVNTLARILTETGETDKALRCFIDETENFPTGLQARLWLARARWQGQAGGVNDLHHAVELADAQDDPRLLGRVRRAIAETAAEWRAAIPAEQREELPGWAIYDLNEHLETLQAWLQCTNWDDQAQLLRSAWPAPTENDVALARAAAERYIDVPEISTLAGFVEAIAEQGLESFLSEMQAMCEAGALVVGWRTAHAERKGRQYLKKYQTIAGNPRCHYVLQRLGLPDEERESLLALLNLAAVSSVDLAYDVAEDLEDADDAIRDFIDAANVPGMNCVLQVRPDLAEEPPHGREEPPHGRFAAALCAYLTGHPEEGRRYLDLIGTTVNPDDRESFRRCVHTLGRDPDYADALAPVAEWLRTG